VSNIGALDQMELDVGRAFPLAIDVPCASLFRSRWLLERSIFDEISRRARAGEILAAREQGVSTCWKLAYDACGGAAVELSGGHLHRI